MTINGETKGSSGTIDIWNNMEVYKLVTEAKNNA